jgi:hypothetical protein
MEKKNISRETSKKATPDFLPQRDPGVPDKLWQHLKASIAAEGSAQKARQEFIAAQEREMRAQKANEESRLTQMRRLQEELLRHQADQKRREELQCQHDQERRRALTAARA